MITAFDNEGRYLGEEYVDLSSLQSDTKKAIIQMINLDKAVAINLDIRGSEIKRTLAIIDACFDAYASSHHAEATEMAEELLGIRRL